MEEPGRLQSLGSQRAGHDSAHTHMKLTKEVMIPFVWQQCKNDYFFKAGNSNKEILVRRRDVSEMVEEVVPSTSFTERLTSNCAQ